MLYVLKLKKIKHNRLVVQIRLPDDRDLEIVFIYGFPGSVKKLFTPEIRLMLRLLVGLIRSDNVFAVGSAIWLDFEYIVAYQ